MSKNFYDRCVICDDLVSDEDQEEIMEDQDILGNRGVLNVYREYLSRQGVNYEAGVFDVICYEHHSMAYQHAYDS